MGSQCEQSSLIPGIETAFLHRHHYTVLECGPNVMAALPNIDGALCSTPQSLADVHCWSTVE